MQGTISHKDVSSTSLASYSNPELWMGCALRLREYCSVWSSYEVLSASVELLVEIRSAVGSRIPC